MIFLYDIYSSSYLIEQARVHLESGNGGRLADGQRIYTASLNAQFALASGWVVVAADCAACLCPCAKMLSLRNSVLACLLLASL